MITTQQELDTHLDRAHIFPVTISEEGPLPPDSPQYDTLRGLERDGFELTPRELLHAIGCKTAALPMSERDECLKSAWLYTNILDLEGERLCFQGEFGSDLQTARSQEVGIGMMCLIAQRHFNVPWDQLGPLPGPGRRFDYRGKGGPLDCIFESKGTSHIGNQSGQIDDGLKKKAAHHGRNERFDIELIISTFIGRDGVEPRILLADPDKSSFRKLFERGDDRYYRLKHYCRVLQFVGLPKSAFLLNQYAHDYLEGGRNIHQTILDEKRARGFLESIWIGDDEFLGRWFDSWLPRESLRYRHLIENNPFRHFEFGPGRLSVFQGMRRDVYESGLSEAPFSEPLLSPAIRRKYRHYRNLQVSVFPDGTVMIFRKDH